jgi:hypothetical protein
MTFVTQAKVATNSPMTAAFNAIGAASGGPDGTSPSPGGEPLVGDIAYCHVRGLRVAAAFRELAKAICLPAQPPAQRATGPDNATAPASA